MPRKSVHGTIAKTDTLTLRMKPKLKYVLELVARRQHRNLSEVTSWAIEQALINQPEGARSLGLGEFPKAVDALWSPYESDRLVLLAQKRPDLMTYEEDVIWRFIKDDDRYWNEIGTTEYQYHRILSGVEKQRGSPNLKVIREEWHEIKRTALESVKEL
jgi:hypothetical protein